MSNTTISPTIGASTLAGIAASMALGIAPFGAVALAGVAPTLTAVGAQASRGGLPVSWSALGVGAVGAATPLMAWTSARLVVSGIFGSAGCLQVQASRDNINWFPIAVVADPVLPGFALYDSDGMSVTAQPNGIVIFSVTLDAGFRYLRPVVLGGDGTTNVSCVGNIGVGAV